MPTFEWEMSKRWRMTIMNRSQGANTSLYDIYISSATKQAILKLSQVINHNLLSENVHVFLFFSFCLFLNSSWWQMVGNFTSASFKRIIIQSYRIIGNEIILPFGCIRMVGFCFIPIKIENLSLKRNENRKFDGPI